MWAKRAPSHLGSALAVLAAILVWPCGTPYAQVTRASDFARQVRELSEPDGTFDTDNLVSNERSYLHVLPALRKGRVSGGAFLGVGPDQNFSYIAAIRPSVAFVVDVRRDNLLLHLMFKALFVMSETRADYLGHLFGRRLSPPPDRWRGASLEKIAAQIDGSASRAADVRTLRRQVDAQIAGFGIPLSAKDFATIDRFHRTFIDAGLSLKFQSWGRAPRSYYPTYRELLLETDIEHHQGNFLVSEDDFQFVRGLQRRDLIIPVVGDLAGPTAIVSVGRAIRQRGEQLSAFYVSNVELYLFQAGVFSRYVDNLSTIPRDSRSVLIRAVFSGPAVRAMPDPLPGYASVSLVQPVEDFAGRHYRSYEELLGSR